MFSESTRFLFVEMSHTLYEHGYKETTQNSIVIVINPSIGILYDRNQELMEVVRNAGAIVFEINESEFDEIYSRIYYSFLFHGTYLVAGLGISTPFLVGSKITERNRD